MRDRCVVYVVCAFATGWLLVAAPSHHAVAETAGPAVPLSAADRSELAALLGPGVVVSDDDDTSPDAVDTYVRFLQQLKGAGAGGRAAIYAIVPSGETCPSASGQGIRFAEAASRTGGAIESVCAPDFGPLLQDVVSRAFSAQTRFPLSGTPDVEG